MWPAAQPGIAPAPGAVNEPVPEIGPDVAFACAMTCSTVTRLAGAPTTLTNPSASSRSSGDASSMSAAASRSLRRTSSPAIALAEPSETVVRPPPTPMS